MGARIEGSGSHTLTIEGVPRLEGGRVRVGPDYLEVGSFIALAALMMGRWNPIGATVASVFFGFMWNLQNQLSFTQKIPGDLLGMAPYLATIVAVAGLVGRVRPPAADGEPYVKA